MKPRLLDLFCGAGGCGVGYSRAGFDVVGVDASPMPRYPFEFHQADALEFLAAHGHEFDVIHASPPCQFYSALRHMPNAKKDHPDLVVPTRELLKASGKPYVIENVPGAPLIRPTMLCGTMFGLGTGNADLRRHRIFETNWILHLAQGMVCKHGRRRDWLDYSDTGTLHTRQVKARLNRTISVTGQRGIAESCGDRKAMKKAGSVNLYGNAGTASVRDGLLYFSTAERNEAMGIDWMKGSEISQAIPPAYTQFIGEQLLAAITKDANG